MAFLEQHPVHVRKKIALGITIGVAAVLLLVMVLIYTVGNRPKGNTADSAFLRFYATILDNAQSFFTPDRAIIPK